MPLAHTPRAATALLCLLLLLLLTPALATMAAPVTPSKTATQADAASAARVTDVVATVDFRVRVAVKFPGASKPVADGQRLKPSATAEEPSATLEGASADKFYTLVEVDPDAPDPANPVYRSYLHWLVVDIPGDKPEACSGSALVKYRKSTPPSGTHRYMFLVFEQRAHSSQSDIRKETPPERNDFSVKDWAKVVGLGDPVGFTYFTSAKEYESQTDL